MKTLYLGTDPSRYPNQTNLVHFPLIQIRPIPLVQAILNELGLFTHILITSPNTVHILHQVFQGKTLLAIGKGTAHTLESYGLKADAIASPESQEGMIQLVATLPREGAYLFYPRSSLARPLLAGYLKKRGVKHVVCNAYETVFAKPEKEIEWDEVVEIVFTSPSTVRAFVHLYGEIPKHVKYSCIGPVTLEMLLKCYQRLL